jgi:hypothetical protein
MLVFLFYCFVGFVKGAVIIGLWHDEIDRQAHRDNIKEITTA